MIDVNIIGFWAGVTVGLIFGVLIGWFTVPQDPRPDYVKLDVEVPAACTFHEDTGEKCRFPCPYGATFAKCTLRRFDLVH